MTRLTVQEYAAGLRPAAPLMVTRRRPPQAGSWEPSQSGRGLKTATKNDQQTTRSSDLKGAWTL